MHYELHSLRKYEKIYQEMAWQLLQGSYDMYHFEFVALNNLYLFASCIIIADTCPGSFSCGLGGAEKESCSGFAFNNVSSYSIVKHGDNCISSSFFKWLPV